VTEPLVTLVPLAEAEPVLEASVPLDADPLDAEPVLEASISTVASEGVDASLGPVPAPWIEMFAQ
jgi:hypothetical protein